MNDQYKIVFDSLSGPDSSVQFERGEIVAGYRLAGNADSLKYLLDIGAIEPAPADPAKKDKKK